MSNGSFNLSTEVNVNLDKFYAQRNTRQNNQEAKQQENIVKQDPSLSGVQWANAQAASQTQASNQADIKQKQTSTMHQEGNSRPPHIVSSDYEDAAVLSTQVATKKESIKPAEQRDSNNILAPHFNMESLKSSFKESFKKSKSHNLLVARFMSQCKFSSVKALISLLGVSAEEQIEMQNEVRKEALAEIDAKLKDCLRTEVMIQITG